ncbi:hypothetical protein B0J11DRAFT_504680 [Dendryphion nanum]|uniref:Uncharacterized protein n=1 Tax=Dendryphion nanum TaxID=256645 RepID=A0A9P9IR53_9PLEO|nr:hypothetical protein B0J11DRAFT_504680 [Dendryphion nanum]
MGKINMEAHDRISNSTRHLPPNTSRHQSHSSVTEAPENDSVPVVSAEASEARQEEKSGTQRPPKIHNKRLRDMDKAASNWELPAMNISIAEFAAYLPRMYQNHFIATRICCNKFRHSLYQFMVLHFHSQHRSAPQGEWDLILKQDQEAFPVSTITSGIRCAMSRGLLDTSKNPKWKVKEHNVPHDWDDQNINIKGLLLTIPNAQFHDPVPFDELLRGLDELPRGRDQADLGRAVCFSAAVYMRTGHKLMFPTDLDSILERVGRTTPNDYHSDPVVMSNWLPRLKQAKSSAQHMSEKRAAGDLPTAENTPDSSTMISHVDIIRIAGSSTHEEDLQKVDNFVDSYSGAFFPLKNKPSGLICNAKKPRDEDNSDFAIMIRMAQGEQNSIWRWHHYAFLLQCCRNKPNLILEPEFQVFKEPIVTE